MISAVVVALSLCAFEPDPLLPGKPYALRGHSDGVSAVAFSPDGKLVASGSRNRTVKVWSLESGALLRTIPGAEVQVSSLEFSPDGKRLLCGATGLQLRVIDVASGEVTKTIAHPDSVTEATWSPDGLQFAAVGVSGNGVSYDAATGAKRIDFRGRSVRWSGDGKTLLVSNAAGSFSWLDAKTGKARKTIETPREAPLTTMSADGAVVASWSAANTDVKLWDAQGAAKATLSPNTVEGRTKPRVTGVAVAADGKRVLVLSADGLLRVWTVASTTVTQTLPTERALSVVVSRDGSWLAVTGDAAVLLWRQP